MTTPLEELHGLEDLSAGVSVEFGVKRRRKDFRKAEDEKPIGVDRIKECRSTFPADAAIGRLDGDVIVWVIHMEALKKVATPSLLDLAEVREIPEEQVTPLNKLRDETLWHVLV